MSQSSHIKPAFWSASALALMLAFQPSAIAQDSDEPEADNAQEGEFLGTLTLGESKREVRTDTPVPITVIDKQEIDDRQASTIAELIDSVPGVTLVNGSTPSGSGINIRGFGANGTFGTDQKVAVVIDGANTGGEELYRIGTQLFTDPFLYRSVAVQRGTVGSYEYGTGIVGGIVLLETIDASDLTGGDPGFNAALTGGYFSNGDGLNGSATLAWQPTENLELLGNYSYREQDNQDDGDGEEIGNSAFELPSFLLKGRYTFGANSDQSITASFTQTETAERDVPYDTFFTTTDAFGNVDRDILNQTASLIYRFQPVNNDLIDLEAALTYANQEIDGSFITGSSPLEANPFFGPVIRRLGDADHQFETTRLTVKNKSFIDTGIITHDLTYGVDIFERKREDEEAAPGGTDDRIAVFLINDIGIGQGFFFTPAIRFESSEIRGSIPDPNAPPQSPFAPPMPTPEISRKVENQALVGGASLRYEFENGLSLFGSYAYTESLPIIDDLENAIFIEQPEKSDTFEAGFSFDRVGVLADSDTLALKLNYFDTKLDDVTSYSGALEIELDGFELEGSYAMSNGFYIDLNANIVDGEELQAFTDPTTMAPARRVIDWDRTPQDTVRATFGQVLFNGLADVSAEVVSAFDTPSDATPPSPVQVIEPDDVTVLNLRATISPQTGVLRGTQLRLGLENATDEAYTPLLATRPAVGQNFKITLSRVF
ncbi:MAG: TonB-dependent receptor [Pseudomonadota bacterium]